MCNRFYLDPTNKQTSFTNSARGKVFVIDALNRIYKQTINACMSDSNQQDVHIYAMFKFVINMLKNMYAPLFVFDGKFPKEKIDAILARKRDKHLNSLKCNLIDSNSQEFMPAFKKSFQLSKLQIMECKKILDLFEISYINAPEEADKQCAEIAKFHDDIICGVISDDFDIVMHGAPLLLKNFSFRNDTIITVNNKETLEYLLKKANEIRESEHMELFEIFTQDNFLDFGIIIGTDYNINQQLQILASMDHILLFKYFVINDMDLKKMINYFVANNIIEPDETYMEILANIKTIYLNAKYTNPADICVKLNMINTQELINFLCVEHDIDEAYVRKELGKVYKNYSKLKKVYENYYINKKLDANYKFNFVETTSIKYELHPKLQNIKRTYDTVDYGNLRSDWGSQSQPFVQQKILTRENTWGRIQQDKLPDRTNVCFTYYDSHSTLNSLYEKHSNIFNKKTTR